MQLNPYLVNQRKTSVEGYQDNNMVLFLDTLDNQPHHLFDKFLYMFSLFQQSHQQWFRNLLNLLHNLQGIDTANKENLIRISLLNV